MDAAEVTARDNHIHLQQYGTGTVPSVACLYHMLTEPRDALGFDVGLERERAELLSLLDKVDWCLTPEAVKELGFERAA